MRDDRQRAAVGHHPLDPLGHELVVAEDVVLEVAVLGVGAPLAARLHGSKRAHAAVGLVLLAIHEYDIAGGLLAASQKTPEHHRVGPGHERLGDVAGELHSPIADDRHSCRSGGKAGLVDRRDLGDAHAGHDARRADGARPDPDLDPVGSGIHERLGTLAGGDVAAHDVDARGALEQGDHLDNGPRMAVRGVNNEEVDAGFDESVSALLRVGSDTDRSADNETAVGVLGGEGVLV